MIDIARMCGVSVATVSKYMNGGKVRPENRERIARAVRESGYSVNYTARALKTCRAMTIGVLTESLTNMFYSSVLSIMDDCLMRAGYSTIISETRADTDQMLCKLELMRSKRVDGIVCLASHCDDRLVSACDSAGLQLVMVDSLCNEKYRGSRCCDFVLTDNVRGARDAARLIIEHGHRNIGILTGADWHFSAAERLKGFRDGLASLGVPVREEFVVIEDYSIEGGYRGATRICAMRERPTAVLVCNYFMNLGAMVAFHEHNVLIGRDMSLVSFDEIQANKAFRPAVTTVCQSLEAIGCTAAERILLRAANPGIPPLIIRVPATLIKRDSVAALCPGG